MTPWLGSIANIVQQPKYYNHAKFGAFTPDCTIFSPYGLTMICVCRVGEHVSLVVCVSRPEEHISVVICVSFVGEQISLVRCVFRLGGHISLVTAICVFGVGEHIALGRCGSRAGEHILLRICHKNKIFKRSKILIFSKGLVHGFRQKLAFFSTFF